MAEDPGFVVLKPANVAIVPVDPYHHLLLHGFGLASFLSLDFLVGVGLHFDKLVFVPAELALVDREAVNEALTEVDVVGGLEELVDQHAGFVKGFCGLLFLWLGRLGELGSWREQGELKLGGFGV